MSSNSKELIFFRTWTLQKFEFLSRKSQRNLDKFIKLNPMNLQQWSWNGIYNILSKRVEGKRRRLTGLEFVNWY